MKYRTTSLAQKALLGIVWLGAIGVVIAIAQSTPVNAQQGTEFSLKMATPIFLALVITIFVLISPTGAVRDYETGNAEYDSKELAPPKPLRVRIKLVFFVLLGMVWVSMIAPLLIAIKIGLEKGLLKPLCSYFSPPTIAVPVSKAHLSMSLQEWWQTSYHPIECLYGEGERAVGLDKLMGGTAELVTNMGSCAVIIILTIAVWFYITYRMIALVRAPKLAPLSNQ